MTILKRPTILSLGAKEDEEDGRAISIGIKVAGRAESYSAFGACFHPPLVSSIARTLRKAPPAGEISIDLQSKGGHR